MCEEARRKLEEEKLIRLFGIEMFLREWIIFWLGVALAIIGFAMIWLMSSPEIISTGTVASTIGCLASFIALLTSPSRRDLRLVWVDVASRIDEMRKDLTARMDGMLARLDRMGDTLDEILRVLRERT